MIESIIVLFKALRQRQNSNYLTTNMLSSNTVQQKVKSFI